MSDGGEGERCVFFADARCIFAEAHIECPVQGVFDRPVTARIRQEACGVGAIVGEIEACFRAGLVADEAGSGDTDNALEVRPVVSLLQPVALLGDLATADFEAALAFINVFVRGKVCTFRRSLEEETHVLMQRALIALETQQVVPAAFDYLILIRI